MAPPHVLEAVRNDPRQTASYYATRYFGGAQHTSTVNCVLWSELKKFGLVLLERPDGPSGEARWVPQGFSRPTRSRVQRHNDDDVDLSVLSTDVAQGGGTPSSSELVPVSTPPSAPSSPLTAPEDPVVAITNRLGPLVLSLVAAYPDKDLPFYLRQIPDEQDKSLAPVVFKQLRLDGKLSRARAESVVGAFVWRHVPGAK